MGIDYLYVSRISDGLVLAASTDASAAVTSAQAAPSSMAGSMNLRARGAAAPAASNRDPRTEGKEVLLRLNSSSPPRCSVEGSAHTYHYAISGPLVVFVATDTNYPKKLAFAYLEEVRKAFWDYVAREHPNTDPGKTVAATDRPYAFIKFDRDLNKLRRDFADPSSKQNIQRVQDNLNDITNIMRTNIDALLQRGDDLNSIRTNSEKLHEDSKSLVWGAKKLNRLALLRRVGPFVAAGALVLFFVWVRLYVM